MLYMVVERFKPENLEPMGERFRTKGRMLPEGVIYQASWMVEDGSKCFQIMESESRGALNQWIACWSDLVDFEIVEVLTSAEYWQRQPPDSSENRPS